MHHDDAPAAPVLRCDSTLVGKSACAFCFGEWDSAHTVSAGAPCNHLLCVGCAVAAVRSALGDVASKVTARGVQCGMFGCGTAMGLATVRRLAEVSRRVLPHADCTRGDPPRPIQPLSVEELRRLAAFVELANIPPAHRAQCPLPACRRVLDVPPPAAGAAPAPAECVFCSAAGRAPPTRVCNACKQEWHPLPAHERAARDARALALRKAARRGQGWVSWLRGGGGCRIRGNLSDRIYDGYCTYGQHNQKQLFSKFIIFTL